MYSPHRGAGSGVAASAMQACGLADEVLQIGG